MIHGDARKSPAALALVGFQQGRITDIGGATLRCLAWTPSAGTSDHVSLRDLRKSPNIIHRFGRNGRKRRNGVESTHSHAINALSYSSWRVVRWGTRMESLSLGSSVRRTAQGAFAEKR